MKRRVKIHCLSEKSCCKIVYYESFDDSKEATNRETELLSFPKELIKILVLENNPLLLDLLENMNH